MALLVPIVFMGCAAFAVDTSNWYANQRDMQKAADAAALAGVPYLPNDLPSATTKALAAATRNGYTAGVAGVTISVTVGNRPTQLKVTITKPVANTFGKLIGSPTTTLTRVAVADYQGPQPMGSPCNTFGNEPSQGVANLLTTATGSALGTTPLTNCSSNPQLWATLQGPQTDKQYGDRYQSIVCAAAGTDNCASSTNGEYADEGYFWVIKVTAGAIGKPITVQLYDPAYVDTGGDCQDLPDGSTTALTFSNNPNPYVAGTARLATRRARPTRRRVRRTARATTRPARRPEAATVTSFVLRDPTDTQDPMKGTVHSGCTMQFGSQLTAPVKNDLTSTSATYDQSLASQFHNWVNFCTFTPTAAGDWYIQVRNNVTAGGTAVANTNSNPTLIWTGNAAAGAATGNTTSGYGNNSFSIRALIQNGFQSSVSVAGYDRMPIYANATGSVQTFNLIRVLPGAAGSYINFSFFDIGDGLTGGNTASLKVVVPSDGIGTITTTPFPGNCYAVGGYAGAGTTLSACTATISNAKNNAKVESMSIPVPPDYDCNYASATAAAGTG